RTSPPRVPRRASGRRPPPVPDPSAAFPPPGSPPKSAAPCASSCARTSFPSTVAARADRARQLSAARAAPPRPPMRSVQSAPMSLTEVPPRGPLLAIAIFGESASVALHRGDSPGALALAQESVGQAHSARILPLVSRVLEESGCTPAELAGVAFEAGPGAFTSLRVACAMAQGFGLALGIPVCPVGSLETAAVSLALMTARSEEH